MPEKVELTDLQEAELARISVYGFGHSLLVGDQLVRKGMITSVPNLCPDPGLMFYVGYHYVLTETGKDYLTETFENELNQTDLPLDVRQNEIILFRLLINGEISDEGAFHMLLDEHNHPKRISNKRLALAQMQGRFEEMVG